MFQSPVLNLQFNGVYRVEIHNRHIPNSLEECEKVVSELA